MVAIALLDTPTPAPPRPALPLLQPRLLSLPSGASAVMALTEWGCRWPRGEVADDDFAFCGAPRGRGSYCAAHRRLAYAGGGR